MPQPANSSAELAQRVIAAAVKRGKRIAVTESLTGGALAASLVNVPGASSVFVGGIVAYDTEVKERLLGVSAAQLAATGPVAAAVAIEMAVGVIRALGVSVDIAVSTTGVAGPDPDPQTGRQPGLFFVGDSYGGVSEHRVAGSRDAVRAAAVVAALLRLEEIILQSTPR